jgi:hypothetical protein
MTEGANRFEIINRVVFRPTSWFLVMHVQLAMLTTMDTAVLITLQHESASKMPVWWRLASADLLVCIYLHKSSI